MFIVCDILRSYLPSGINVWVFGSRADWTTKDSSDLDLALEGDSEIDYKIIYKIEFAFEDSDLPYNVDIIDLKTVNSNFKKIVDKQKVPLEINIKHNWQKIRLGDFISLKYGKPLPEKRQPGNIPIVDSNVVGYHNVGLTSGSTVTIDLDKLKIGYFPKSCWPVSNVLYLSEDDDLLLKFKYYTLCMVNLDVNSDISTLNEKILFIPNKEEQKSISRILGTLDERIDIGYQMNQTLEEITFILFKCLFVDYLPTRTKMNGKQRDELADLYDLFPDRMVKSELGLIPEGWMVKSFDEIIQYDYQSKDSAEYNLSNEIPSKFLVYDGDVVFSWSETLVKIWRGGCTALNQNLSKITSKYPKWFYYYLLKLHIENIHKINDTKCVVPDSNLLNATDKIFSNLLKQQISNEKQNQTLVKLRNDLLPKLLFGYLDVKSS